MKDLGRDLIRSTIVSIGMAMVIFCIVGVVFDVTYGGEFRLEEYRFTKMVLGCVGIGIGFGVPSIVYRRDSLPLPIRFIIHMGIGLVIYTLIAYSLGWIGGAATMGQGVIIALIQLAVAFIIWFFFMRGYKREAKKINEKIQEMK